MSSPARPASEPSDEERYCEPSPESNIRDCECEKWGFIIYRTTYDEASVRPWIEFKDCVLRNLRDSILDSDAPEILNNTDFVFVEDPTEEGREHVKVWHHAIGTEL